MEMNFNDKKKNAFIIKQEIFEFNIMKSGENLIGAVNNFNELLTSNGLGVLKQTGETEYLYNFTIENKV